MGCLLAIEVAHIDHILNQILGREFGNNPSLSCLLGKKSGQKTGR